MKANLPYHVREACKNNIKRVDTGFKHADLTYRQTPCSTSRSSRLRRRLRTVKILEAICLAGLAVILSYVFLYVSDRVWETPPTLGWILFICALAGLLTFIPWWSFRWVWQRRTAAQLARLIGKKDAALGDRPAGGH